MAYEASQDVLNPLALILPKELNATITGDMDAGAEMGTIVYDIDNNKVMFVKAGAGSETFDSL